TRAPFAFLLVSHDRYFLENVTNRTVELNPAYADGYLSIDSHYSDFLVKKEEFLAAQASLEQSIAGRGRRGIGRLPRRVHPRLVMGQPVPVHAAAVGHGRPRSFRRRAGADFDCPHDAPTGRSSHPRRTYQ